MHVHAFPPSLFLVLYTVDFCDPQSGKGPCDRMAAVIKCNIRRHIDEKNDVVNSRDFVRAASDTKFVSIYSSSISSNEMARKEKSKWPGVKKMNNFEYTKSIAPTSIGVRASDQSETVYVTCWRAWNVGKGKEFPWKTLHTVATISPLAIADTFSVTNTQWSIENEGKGDDISYARQITSCNHNTSLCVHLS